MTTRTQTATTRTTIVFLLAAVLLSTTESVHGGCVTFCQPFSLGDTFTCFLTDAAVNNDQLGNETFGSPVDANFASPMPPLNVDLNGSRAVQVSAGRLATCILTATGGVRCWGDNYASRLGYGEEPPVAPPHATDIEFDSPNIKAVYVDAGVDSSCVLLEDGRVSCFGRNLMKVIGSSNSQETFSPPSTSKNYISMPQSHKVKQICVGAQHACALTVNGSVACWGNSLYTGYAGLDSGDVDPSAYVSLTTNASLKAVKIACGEYHTAVLLENGKVKTFGDWSSGKLGYSYKSIDVGRDQYPSYYNPLNGFPDEFVRLYENSSSIARHIACGSEHTCVIDSIDQLFCFGSGQHGRLGYGNSNTVGPSATDLLPHEAGVVDVNVESVELGAIHTCVTYKNSANVKCFGGGQYGATGYGITDHLGDDANETPSQLGAINLGATPLSSTACSLCDWNGAQFQNPPTPAPTLAPTATPSAAPTATSLTTAPTTSPTPASVTPTTTPTAAPSVTDVSAAVGANDNSGSTTAIYAATIGGGASVLLCVIVLAVLFARRRSKRKHHHRHKSHTATHAAQQQQPHTSTVYDTPLFHIARNKSATARSIEAAELERMEQLGEGSFGVVYRGKWDGKEVAIKEIKGDAVTEKERAEFKAEAKQMMNLVAHPNVVLFYGLCEEPLRIVTEFLSGGSLDDLVYSPRAIEDAKLHVIALGAARGVAHLHAQQVIHRDLAARNILLDDDWNAKVADFGMARAKEEETYYQQTKTNVGPIRWMAPEQMRSMQYSTHSDCYSYAVLLYEIYARAKPWDGMLNLEVAQEVLNGKSIAIPKNAPKHVQKVMKQLLLSKPTARLTMKKAVAALESGFNAPPEPDYMQLALAPPSTDYDTPPVAPPTGSPSHHAHKHHNPHRSSGSGGDSVKKKGKRSGSSRQQSPRGRKPQAVAVEATTSSTYDAPNVKEQNSSSNNNNNNNTTTIESGDASLYAPMLPTLNLQYNSTSLLQQRAAREKINKENDEASAKQYGELQKQYVSMQLVPMPASGSAADEDDDATATLSAQVHVESPALDFDAMESNKTSELELLRVQNEYLQKRVDAIQSAQSAAQSAQTANAAEMRAVRELLATKTLHKQVMLANSDKPRHLSFYRTVCLLVEQAFVGFSAAASGAVELKSQQAKKVFALKLAGGVFSFLPGIGEGVRNICYGVAEGVKELGRERQFHRLKRIAMLVGDEERSELGIRLGALLVDRLAGVLARLPAQAVDEKQRKSLLEKSKLKLLHDESSRAPPSVQVAEFAVARAIVGVEIYAEMHASSEAYVPIETLAQELFEEVTESKLSTLFKNGGDNAEFSALSAYLRDNGPKLGIVVDGGDKVESIEALFANSGEQRSN